MREPILEGRRVFYRVDGATLLAGVDLAAAEGEFVGVLGPNGAGKTTLLKLLAGDLVPTEGEVIVGGRSTAETPPSELSFLRSVLADHVPADIPFTARSVVEMGRFPYRRDPDNSPERDARAVSVAMERTDTARFSGRVFSTLSSGERARVFLARVLAQEAPIVLLDEPTAALDVRNREHILTEAAALARQGRAIVSVLHDLNAAAFYADRLVLMADGMVRAEGQAPEVLNERLLNEVYDQRMHVVDHPFRDCPLVLVGDPSVGSSRS